MCCLHRRGDIRVLSSLIRVVVDWAFYFNLKGSVCIWKMGMVLLAPVVVVV